MRKWKKNSSSTYRKLVKALKFLWKNSFKLLDLNDNGVISFEEWKSHYVVRGIPTEYARASFDAMDKNGDGEISLEEFVAYNYEYFCSDEDKLSSSILYGPLEWLLQGKTDSDRLLSLNRSSAYILNNRLEVINFHETLNQCVKQKCILSLALLLPKNIAILTSGRHFFGLLLKRIGWEYNTCTA